ncbi:MAG: hypothetical protein IAC77_01335 [Proteobacteria bacterium]|uniref:Uncharacterized protein n=1 Tax=Candidatus Enterousia excrementavium TaxID=2840789 RepID=A0A940IBX7_9PROT|nr:hypothetical protein [Candidatus Enterousia excrementavium]
METKLMPIFALRAMLLKRISPQSFARNADLIKRTSLAAQDYVRSGKFYEYDRRTGYAFRQLPGYIDVHKRYNIPYNPSSSPLDAGIVNPGLVMDLAWALNSDMLANIVDRNGNIIAPDRLFSSEVLQVYHNSSGYGVPIDAFNAIQRTQRTAMLSKLQRTK